RRCCKRGTCALSNARREQDDRLRSQPRNERRRGEDEDACEKHAPGAETVGELSCRQQQDGKRQRVAVDEPLEAAEGKPKAPPYVRQHDVQRRVAEQKQERGDREREERPPRAGIASKGRRVGQLAVPERDHRGLHAFELARGPGTGSRRAPKRGPDPTAVASAVAVATVRLGAPVMSRNRRGLTRLAEDRHGLVALVTAAAHAMTACAAAAHEHRRQHPDDDDEQDDCSGAHRVGSSVRSPNSEASRSAIARSMSARWRFSSSIDRSSCSQSSWGVPGAPLPEAGPVWPLCAPWPWPPRIMKIIISGQARIRRKNRYWLMAL